MLCFRRHHRCRQSHRLVCHTNKKLWTRIVLHDFSLYRFYSLTLISLVLFDFWLFCCCWKKRLTHTFSLSLYTILLYSNMFVFIVKKNQNGKIYKIKFRHYFFLSIFGEFFFFGMCYSIYNSMCILQVTPSIVRVHPQNAKVTLKIRQNNQRIFHIHSVA